MELSGGKTSLYASLSLKKNRDKYNLFVAEGYKCVKDLADGFEPEAFIIRKGTQNLLNEDFLKSHRETIYFADNKKFNKISGLTTPSDIIAVFKKRHLYAETEKLCKEKLYLMLDNIQDPGNMGTIIRTADWFGIDVIFASECCVDIYNPKVVQSTMGSLKRVKVVYGDLKEIIEKNQQLPLYGLLLEGENIYKADLKNEGFILMGNEGRGISEYLRSLITNPLLIPSSKNGEHAESLNVAIATGITLSLFRKENG